MKFKMIVMIAAAIFAVGSTGTSASAQDCGCGGGGYTGVVPGNYGGYGGFGGIGYDSSCGRGISSSQAAGLWGGYCSESCAYTGPQRQGLFGRHGGCGLKNRGGGGCFGGCGGFNQGCFGYPSCGCGGGGGCGCGSSIGSYSSCDGGCDTGGGCGGGHFGGRGCGCGLKAKLAGLRSSSTLGGGAYGYTGGGSSSCGRGGCLRGGCGVKGRFFNKMLARHSQNSYIGYASTDAYSSCSYLTSGCDTCGSQGGYFNEAVGYEYGNGGMQSYVNGSLTSACGGGGCGCGCN